MSTLLHSNVTRTFAICLDQCLIVESMKQGSLLEYLQGDGRSLKLPQLIDKAAEIASGMAYLEQQQYVHGDLAARNVTMTDNLTHCKLSDCGFIPFVCKHGDGIRFTDKWKAPEAALQKKFSVKFDIWSFDIVLYEIITYGQMPYPGINNKQTLERAEQGHRMPCPANCPNKLYNTMLFCWKANLEDRPTFEHLK